MTDSFLFNSTGDVLFIILGVIPICFYFFWKIGYNFRLVKIPILLSIGSAFYFFLISNNYMFTFEDSLKNVIEKLLFLNLLFFSTIFTIIIFIVPSNQNTCEKPQSSIIQEVKDNFTPFLKWNDNKNNYNSTQLGNKYKEEDLIQDDLKRISEREEQENSDDEFQKLINDIFENQK